MSNIKVGAQLYTIREFTKTPEDIEKSLRKIKALGFDVIQISAFGPMDPQKLADLVHELDLDVCVTHTPYDRLKNDLDNVIKEHKMLGCDTIGLGGMPNEFRCTYEGLKKFMEEARVIGRKIHDNGLQFAYHNHKFEFQKFDGKLGMDRLIDELAPEELGFIPDTYWVQAGGAEPAEYIKKFKGRVKVLHFKDMTIKDDAQIFTEIGNGNIDFKKVWKVCEELSIPYVVIEQDRCEGDPFESLKTSFDYIMNTLAK